LVDILYSVGLGVIAGLLPVYLGLLPLHFVRRLSLSKRILLISFSAGILLFLFADVIGEAIKLASSTVLGSSVFTLGLILGLAGPVGVSYWKTQSKNNHGRHADDSASKNGVKLVAAYMIALGIGLHNFGEGLALGTASAAGQVALTTVLVVGFALHNGTEGMGITGPMSDIPYRVKDPLLLGFIAGFPTVLGSALGSIVYSSLMAALFFSVASGALLYVTVELIRVSYSPRKTFLGMVIGLLLMYFTNLLLST
jgi:ZIP family zinc transporter